MTQEIKIDVVVTANEDATVLSLNAPGKATLSIRALPPNIADSKNDPTVWRMVLAKVIDELSLYAKPENYYVHCKGHPVDSDGPCNCGPAPVLLDMGERARKLIEALKQEGWL